MSTPEELARLITIHLRDFQENEPNWTVAHSVVAGRGVFATRDIAIGEFIFRERPLVVGPTARKGSVLNTCVCCHKLLAVKDFLCKHKCMLPVCDACADSALHREECALFQRWQPVELSKLAEICKVKNGELPLINPFSLRILTAVRVFFLQPEQRALVDAMQANADRSYRQEIIKAAQSFRQFPKTDKTFMDNLFRFVGVLNTNAFEAPCHVGEHDSLVRGLFPLTAIMNHECTPNASHYFDNAKLAIVRAARHIPKGTEITTTYTKILWSNPTRCIFLKMTKHFICDCQRCNDKTVSGEMWSWWWLVSGVRYVVVGIGWLLVKVRDLTWHTRIAVAWLLLLLLQFLTLTLAMRLMRFICVTAATAAKAAKASVRPCMCA